MIGHSNNKSGLKPWRKSSKRKAKAARPERAKPQARVKPTATDGERGEKPQAEAEAKAKDGSGSKEEVKAGATPKSKRARRKP